MARFEREQRDVALLVALTGIQASALVDPNKRGTEESGVDVVFNLGSRKIGVQVTEYNPDEGLQYSTGEQSRA